MIELLHGNFQQVGIKMYTFFLRFLLFISLWVLMIHDVSDQLNFSLFMLTISLTIFFFLSNKQASIYLYVFLAFILFLHGMIIGDFIYISLLLLFFYLFSFFFFI